MEIPSVAFNHSKRSASTTRDVDIVVLDNLYRRLPKLDHNPGLPHRVGFHMLIHIEQGQGSHFIDFNQYPFGPGSFIFLNQNQVHAFDLERRPSGTAILFTSDFVERMQASMRAPLLTPAHLALSYHPVFTPEPSLGRSCDALLAEIQQELARPESSDLIVMMLFSSLLLMLYRERQQDSEAILTASQQLTFRRFVGLLESGAINSRDASDYARRLHLTYKTLNQICKAATGQTSKQLIDAQMVLEAKRLLVLEQKSIQQLAWDLGFDDSSNFVKYFKKHTLLTPSQFQKQFAG